MSDIKTAVKFDDHMRQAILSDPVVQAEIEMSEDARLASIRGIDSQAFVAGYEPADSPVRRTVDTFKAKSIQGKIQPKSSEGKSQPQAAWLVVHEDNLADVLRVIKSIQRDQGFPIVEKGAFDKAHSFEKDERGYVSIPMFAQFSGKEQGRLEAKGGHVKFTTKNVTRRIIPTSKDRQIGLDFDME
jgi:hypothetical protein